ncbi:hypothetical protein B9Z55_010409 [Caenorhabditis nigoni]|uniref:Uncharacterized protein n=1 Tax=Caenorhabditis nigoni TaxID=1611254 RepID=A0A2G5UFP6_9PELO|nr:hypothetical protein B9Z55_010409 [Caenorhabditis nigoni]
MAEAHYPKPHNYTVDNPTKSLTEPGNFKQRLESKNKNTINDLYAVMDETSPEAAARRRSLQIASQTTTTKDFLEPRHNTNSTATSRSLSTTENVHWIVKVQ